jgi:hypothetical protein
VSRYYAFEAGLFVPWTHVSESRIFCQVASHLLSLQSQEKWVGIYYPIYEMKTEGCGAGRNGPLSFYMIKSAVVQCLHVNPNVPH